MSLAYFNASVPQKSVLNKVSMCKLVDSYPVILFARLAPALFWSFPKSFQCPYTACVWTKGQNTLKKAMFVLRNNFVCVTGHQSLLAH